MAGRRRKAFRKRRSKGKPRESAALEHPDCFGDVIVDRLESYVQLRDRIDRQLEYST